MSFRLYPYRAKPQPKSEPLKGRRKKARRAKHALSGFQETDVTKDTDLASTFGSVTPAKPGQD